MVICFQFFQIRIYNFIANFKNKIQRLVTVVLKKKNLIDALKKFDEDENFLELFVENSI